MPNFNPQILFEDNHLIAINKPAGMLCQGDKTGDTPLVDLMKNWLKQKYNKPGNVFCGLIHRLDRPTSGVLLLAKTSKALERMNKQFKDKQTQKTYWAIINQKPNKKANTLINYLVKNQKNNKSKAFSKEIVNAKRAELDYELLGSSDKYHLVEVKPKTGRHHQIRVQLASIGCIIKGDLKYGAKRSNKDASIHLHAAKLSFIHPVKKEKVTIIAKPNLNDALWKWAYQQHGKLLGNT